MPPASLWAPCGPLSASMRPVLGFPGHIFVGLTPDQIVSPSLSPSCLLGGPVRNSAQCTSWIESRRDLKRKLSH